MIKKIISMILAIVMLLSMFNFGTTKILANDELMPATSEQQEDGNNNNTASSEIDERTIYEVEPQPINDEITDSEVSMVSDETELSDTSETEPTVNNEQEVQHSETTDDISSQVETSTEISEGYISEASAESHDYETAESSTYASEQEIAESSKNYDPSKQEITTNTTSESSTPTNKTELSRDDLEEMIHNGATLNEISSIAPIAFIGGEVSLEYFTAIVATHRENTTEWSSPMSINELLSSYEITANNNWSGAMSGVQGATSTNPLSNPPRYTYEDNFPQIAGHQIYGLTVNGATVVRIGNVQIAAADGTEQNYIYYSASESTDAMTSVVLNTDDKIQIAYALSEYPVTYEIYDENGSILGIDNFTLNNIFGAQRPTTTQDQWLSIDVEIPSGHYGRVYIGDTAGFVADSSTEKFPIETGYGNYRLGQPVVWKQTASLVNGGAEVDTSASAPTHFSLAGTYTSGQPGSADAPQTVRVVITTRPENEYHFNANFLGTAITGDEQNKLKWFNYGSLTSFDDKNFVYDATTGTYSCQWEFSLRDGATSHYEMRSLSLNNNNLNIPFLKDPRQLINPDGSFINPDSPDNSVTATTVLSGGMTVTITVTPILESALPYNRQRHYTISITNANRDIVFDHGTFINAAATDYSEVVSSLFQGVEVQIFRKASNGAASMQWLPFLNAQSYRAVPNGTYTFDYDVVGDPSGRNYNINSNVPSGIYGNIRFRLIDGYNWAQGKIEGSETFPTVQFYEEHTNIEDSQVFDSTNILGPDSDGYYYITLENPYVGNTRIGMLTIQAQPKLYRVQYLDGISEGSALNPDLNDISVRNMPTFREISDDGSEIPGSSTNIDTNRGNYYAVIRSEGKFTSDKITISGTVPRTTGEHPATFLGWVLTDKDGNPYGEEEYIKQVNDSVSLADIDDAAEVYDINEQNYTIYLTAKWSTTKSLFSYYTTFNYTDATGNTTLRWGEDSDEDFPDESGGKYISRRQVYTTLDSVNVVFESDKSTTENKSRAEQWLDANIWYKYDITKNGSEGHEKDFFWENIRNEGEVAIWFVSSLGELTFSKELAEDASDVYLGEEVSFEATFTMPEDDSATNGNEHVFFTDGVAHYIVNGEEKTFPVEMQSGGVYTGIFTIKVGEDAIFQLPAGTQYVFTEQDNDFFEPTSPVSGTIVANTTNTASLKNIPAGIDIVKTQTIDGVVYTSDMDTPMVGCSEQIKYTITITNRSSSKQTTVTVTDPVPQVDEDGNHLPMRVLERSISDDGYVVGGEDVESGSATLKSGGVVHWPAITLAPDESKELTFTCVVPIVRHEHIYTNTASVEFYTNNPSDAKTISSNSVSVLALEDWLRIEKTVDPKGSALNETFQFEVSLEAPVDSELDPTYDYVGRVVSGYEDQQEIPTRGTYTQSGGKFTVTLKEGQAVTIYGIAVGTNYTVKELDKDGYYANTPIVSGSISADKQDWLQFTNIPVKNLIITKDIEGINAPKDKSFDVNLSFKLPENASNFFDNSPSYRITLTKEGDFYKGTTTITNKTPIVIQLPYGTEYSVEEGSLDDINEKIQPNKFENTETINGSGTISDKADSEVKIINTYAGAELIYHFNAPETDDDLIFADDFESIEDGIYTYNVKQLRDVFTEDDTSSIGLSNFNATDGHVKIGETTWYFAGWSTNPSASSYADIEYRVLVFQEGSNKGARLIPDGLTYKTSDTPAHLYGIWTTKPAYLGYTMTIQDGDFASTTATSDGQPLGDNGLTGTTHAKKYVVLTPWYTLNDPAAITTEKPTAKDTDESGPIFIAWRNKKAGDSNDPNDKSNRIVFSGDTIKFSDTNTVYSLDAIWGTLSAQNNRVSYDGNGHSVSNTIITFDGGVASEMESELRLKYNISITGTAEKTSTGDLTINNESVEIPVPQMTKVGVYTYDITIEVTKSDGTTVSTLRKTATLIIDPILTVKVHASIDGCEWDGDSFTFTMTDDALTKSSLQNTDTVVINSESETGSVGIVEFTHDETASALLHVDMQHSTRAGMIYDGDKSIQVSLRYNKDNSDGLLVFVNRVPIFAQITSGPITEDALSIDGNGNYVLDLLFVNRYVTGTLNITKRVNHEGNTHTDDEAYRDGPFNFTIMSDMDVNWEGLEISGISTTLNSINARSCSFTMPEDIAQNYIDGKTATITGVPVGVTYTIAEDDVSNKYATTYPSGRSVTLSGNMKDGSLTVVNTHYPGGLVISKEVDDPYLGAKTDALDTEFEFTVQINDSEGSPIAGQRGEYTFDDTGTTTIYLKNGESVIIPDLDEGYTYTVTETSDSNYRTTVNGAQSNEISGEILSSTEKQNHVNFINTFDVGSLTVTKEVISNTTAPRRRFEMKLTLSGDKYEALKDYFAEERVEELGYDATINDNIITFYLYDGETFTMDDLPAGISYSLQETKIAGFEPSYENETGIIKYDEASTINVTNTYKSGSLTIVKKLAGPISDAEKEQQFNINIELQNNGNPVNGTYSNVVFRDGRATISLKGDESKTITNLPEGTTYTITESIINNFTPSITGGDNDNGTGTISNNDSDSITVTNTRKSGNIKISKILNGSLANGDTEKEFTITLTLPESVNGTFHTSSEDISIINGIAKIKLHGGESITINNIPAGITYTVEEENPGSEFESSIDADTGAIPDNDIVEVTITNTHKSGSLQITKTVSGDAGDTNQSFNFTVRLDDDSISGTYGEMIFDAGIAHITLKHGEDITADNLPEGIRYTVVEDDGADMGYTVSSSGAAGNITSDNVMTASFTNTKNIPRGTLVITKTVEDSSSSDEFSFDITLDASITEEFGSTSFVNGKATVFLHDGEEVVIEGIPVGTHYTVTEKQTDGYYTNTPAIDDNISTTDKHYARFVNVHTGELIITKAVSGRNAPTDILFPITVQFTLPEHADTFFGEDTDYTTQVDGLEDIINLKQISNRVYTADISIKANNPITFTLPESTSYEISENNLDDINVSVYPGKFEFTEINNKSGTISINTENNVIVRNTYYQPGNLYINKVLTGDFADTSKTWTFEVILSDKSFSGIHGDMNFTNGEATVTMKGGERKFASGIPAGTTYSVRELEENTHGYVTTYETDETRTIASGKDSIVIVTNHRQPQHGSLTLTKTVDGDMDEPDRMFNFAITVDGVSDGQHGDVIFTDGTATAKLRDGDSINILDLPAFAHYKVEETDANTGGYKTTATNDKGQIKEADNIEVSFINSVNVGNLVISKTVDNLETKDKFIFTITLEDDNGELVTADFPAQRNTADDPETISFVDGTATVKLGADENIKIMHIPNEYTYSVEEARVDGFITYVDVDGDGETQTQSGEGTIVAQATSEIDFRNDYSAECKAVINKSIVDTEGEPVNVNATLRFALFDDEDLTSMVSDVKELVLSNQSSGEVEFTGLLYGKTYYIGELDEDNNVINDLTNYFVDGNSFTVNFDTNKFVANDGSEDIEITCKNVTSLKTVADYTKLNITKTLIGREPLDKDVYTFVLEPLNSAPMPAENQLTLTLKDEPESIFGDAFGEITFTEPGYFRYTIHELEESLGGITYDKTVYRITIHVEQLESINGTVLISDLTSVEKSDDGVEFTSVNLDNDLAFTNAYAVTPITFAPHVYKTVTGNVTHDKTFQFTLAKDGVNTAILPEETTVEITGNGDTSFDDIHFVETGTYNFTISEKNTNEAGYTYDTNTYTLTIKVIDDTDGHLVVESSHYYLNGETEKDTATFTNDYQTTDISTSINISKKVTDKTPQDHKFNFTLKLTSDNADSVKIPNTTTSITGTGTTSFDDIKFTKVGIYTFDITEDFESVAGYSFDSSTYKVTITVEDIDSVLTITSTEITKDGDEVSDILFTNNYNTTEVSYAPVVEKVINGDPTPVDKQFTFTIEGNDDLSKAVIKNNSLTLTGAASSAFDAMTFTESGTYSFTIKETAGKDGGYAYSDDEYTLEIVVVDDNSILKIDSIKYTLNSKDTDRAVFENTYTVKPTELTLDIAKKLTGPKPPIDTEFTFTLEPISGNYKDTLTGSITGTGNLNIGPIEFTAAGEYSFQLTEDKLNAHGYTYDDTVYIININVVDTDGILSVDSYKYFVDDQEQDALEFTNNYDEQAVSHQFEVEKTVEGDTPVDKEFRFNIEAKDTENLVMPEDTTATIVGSGITTFDAIKFTRPGEYGFTITEENTAIAGYTYDETVYTAVVTVIDNDSVLKIESIEYTKDGEPCEAIEFTNTYDSEAVAYNPVVEKTISGNTPPVDKEFTFLLEADSQDGMTLPENLEATITGIGKGTFGAINFTKAGTYTFTIKEKIGSDYGYTYDGTEWTLTIKVEDIESILTITSVEYTNDALEGTFSYATFDNIYNPDIGVFKPEVDKIVEGEVVQDARFMFQLDAEEQEGMTLPDNLTLEIVGSDTGFFDDIEFDRAGEYTFTIKEIPFDSLNYTFDDTVYTVTVKIVDEDGHIRIGDVIVNNGTEETERVVFTNIYEPIGTTYQIPVSKVIDGDTPDENIDFTFVLESDDDRITMSENNTATITGTGDALFDNIKFSKAGEYTFTVKELTNTEAENYTFDESVWTVKMTVMDVGGKLEVYKVDYLLDGKSYDEITFHNEYNKPESPPEPTQTPGETQPPVQQDEHVQTGQEIHRIEGWIFALAGIFVAVLAIEIIQKKRKKK